VLAHINALEAQHSPRSGRPHAPQNLLNVLRDVGTTLTLAAQASGAARASASPLLLADPRVFVALPRRLRAPPFRLLQSEVLQIFNHVPCDRDRLAMLLEDAEQRFGEDQLDEMVRIIEDVLVKGEGLDEVGALEDGGGGENDGRKEAKLKDVATGEES